MPTYAYVCTQCSHDFEIVQAISDGALTTCPECGGVLRKVFHPVGVAFKGSGFYRTDSRSDGAKESGAGKKAAASDGDGAAKPAAAASKEAAGSTSSGSTSGSSKSSGSSSGSSSTAGTSREASSTGGSK